MFNARFTELVIIDRKKKIVKCFPIQDLKRDVKNHVNVNKICHLDE